MGDITGRPKTPSPQVVYVPQYTSSTSAPTTTDNTQNEEAQELTPEKQREKNLLSRPRSRIGTILTSFRGILSPSETQAASARKTLLGE